MTTRPHRLGHSIVRAVALEALLLLALTSCGASGSNGLEQFSLVLTSSGGGTINSDPPGIDCRSDCLLSSVVFPKGTEVTLFARPDSGAVLVGWSGACTGTDTCRVRLAGDVNVTATFTALTYPVEVRVTGNGEGRVLSSLGAIDCPAGACSATFPFSTVVTLTAETRPGSEFVGWTGSCEGQSPTCQLVLDRARPVTATFRKLRHDLAVMKAGTGAGLVRSTPGAIECGTNCSTSYEHGASVTLVPTPEPSAFFAGWSGDCMGTEACVLTMDRARAVTATFTTIQYLVSVLRNEGGRVNSTPAGITCGARCESQFTLGTQLTLAATPFPGARFAGWSGACTGTADCLLSVAGPRTVTARFVYPVTVNKRGTGDGTVVSEPSGLACGATCVAEFDPNVNVTLVATPDANSTFAGWSGACNGPTETCTVRTSEARSVTASFTKKTYALVVNNMGTGQGRVASAPAGIDCGTECAASFDAGTTVTLSASPTSLSTFAGWSGACSGTEPCTLLMDRVRFVTATFARITYPLSINRNGAGTVSSDPAGIYCGTACSAAYDAGATITLTATPDPGTSFEGWAGACSGTGPCTLTMDAPKTVLATFRRVVFRLGVSTGAGGGTVTSNPAGIYCGATCEASFDGNVPITLTATPDVTGVFAGWSGACSGTRACTLALDADKTVAARFTFPLNVTRTGQGQGRVVSEPAGLDCGTTCSQQVDNARIVRLTAEAAAGSFFGGWSGDCSGTGSCSVTMTAARNVSANFTTGSFTLNVTRTGGGSGRVASTPAGVDCGSTCSAPFGAGATVTLNATADDSSTFGGWSGACAGAGLQCTVTLDASKNVTATFNRRSYPLMVNRTGPGLVTADSGGIFCGAACTANFAAGTTVTLTATANDGALFSGWTGACTGSAAACTVTVDAAKAVDAAFTTRSYTLTVGRGGAGSGAVASTPAGIDCGGTCNASFAHGTVVTLNASAAAGSVFAGWSGACGGTGACTVTVTNARTATATFDRATYPLTVTRTGSGAGRVFASSGSLDCGLTCAASYVSGTLVTLTQVAEPTSVFAGWSGACTGTGACAVTLDAARAIAATFTRLTHVVTVANTGGGVVASTPIGLYCGAACAASFGAGEVVLLDADPEPNATFAGWSGACTGTEPCTLSIDSAKSLNARFTFPLQIDKRGTGSGRVRSATLPALDCGTTCALDVTAQTQVTLTATADAGSRFVGWGGPCEGTGTCAVTLDDLRVVVATFAPNVVPLTVTRTGSGAGRVTSVPTGIDCGSGGAAPAAELCELTYATGASVTLTATPNASSRFSGWTGACTGSLSTCTLAMTDARAVTATFTRTTSTLTVARAGTAANAGTVTSTPAGVYCGASCSAAFETGALVTLTATADSQSAFAGWSGACSGSGACSLTLDANKSVTATFNRLSFALAVTRAGNGDGAVTSSLPGIDCGATCTANFDVGTVVTLTATPTALSTFSGWGGSCTGAGACTITLSQSRSVTATFVKRSFDVAVQLAGNGAGTVSSTPAGIDACAGACNAAFVAGTPITLTASAASSSTFAGWSGACTGQATCTLPLTSAASVTATFTKRRFALAVTRTGPGTVTSVPAGLYCGAACASDFDAGTSVVLTATPDPSATFTGWGGACAAAGSATTCTVTTNAAQTVTATFATTSHLLTVQRAGTSTGRVASTPAGIDCGGVCTIGYDAGTVVTLSATPDAQAVFTGWSGACAGTGACTLTMSGARNVTATFDLNRYVLTVAKLGNGGGTITSGADGLIDCGTRCAATYTSGATVTLSAIPSPTATFAGWSGACTGSTTCVVVMNQAQTVSATFSSASFSLAVSTGTGGGDVISTPAGIACGAACSASFANGTLVTLTAVPDATATFAGWGGACSGTGNCQVAIDGAKTVSARFTYPLSVVRAGTGTGTVTSSPAGLTCGGTCTFGFARAELVTLTASPDAQSTFTGWSGACTGSTACVVNMDSARTVTATFVPATYALTVSRNGSGSGQITSGDTPRTIDCGTGCAATYTTGASLTLTAAPDASSTFAGWSGGCSGTGLCTVSMTAARSVAATFLKRTATLTIARTGGGEGTVTSNVGGVFCGAACTTSLDAGTQVTLTATPDSTATFGGWSGGGCSGLGACTVSLNADTTVTATFTTNVYALSVTRAGTGSGRVSSNPSGIDCPSGACASNYAAGTVVTLTATPDATSTFTGWSGACSGTGACTATMTAARAVTATFARQSYTLTVAKTGSGTGAVRSNDTPRTLDCGSTCSASYLGGTTVTLNPTADADSSFVGWSGACAGTGACIVTLNAAATVTATFARRTALLTLTRTEGGTVTSSPAGLYCGAACAAGFDVGSTVTLTASANAGATFVGWTGGGCGVASTCAVTMDAAKTVHARFTVPLSLAKIGTGAGTLSSTPTVAGVDCASCNVAFDGGATLTLAATPDATSRFDGWSGACNGAGTCVLTMDAPKSATATFTRVVHTLTVSKLGGGGGSVTSGDTPRTLDCGATCSAGYTQGATVTLTATPDGNSTFAGWTGACTTSASTCTVSMTQARSAVATFTRRTVTLSIARTGAGTVTGSTGGLFCGAACASVLEAGTALTLTATPDAGTSFMGWSGGGCSGTAPCTLTVSASTTVTATFAVVQQTLTVTRGGTGGGAVTSNPGNLTCAGTCNASFATGTVVTLNATPDATSAFTAWSGACTGTGACTVTMNDAQTVTATFTRQSYALTVTRLGSGGGTVAETPTNAAGIQCGTTCAASYTGGTTVALTATADGNSTFVGWSGACSGSTSCSVAMTGATTVSATFVRKTYAVAITRTGGGTIASTPAGLYCGAACTAPFDAGSTVTLTASPDPGATFAGYTGGGCAAAAACAVTVDSAKSVAARFTYPLTVGSAGTGAGTISSGTGGPVNCAACSAAVDGGATVTLTATPDTTSAFTGWAGACNGTANPCVVTMDAVRSVTATFTRVLHTLAVTKIGSGAGHVTSGDMPQSINCGDTCSATYTTGTSVTLTAAADATSSFVAWTGACTASTPTCTVAMSQARTVTATFARRQVSLTISRVGAGTITSSVGGLFCGSACTATLDAGTQVTLTATADPTTTFTGWGGACASAGANPCTLTLTADTTIAATFSVSTFALNVTRAGAGGGTVVSNPIGVDCPAGACAATFTAGTVVTLSAQPDATSTFAGWSGGVCVGTGACTVTMTAVRNVTATFTRNSYTLVVGKAGTGTGTITSNETPASIACGSTCTASYVGGATVVLTALADATSTFSGWSGACAGTGTCSVVMNQNASVTATFARRSFTVSVARTGSGLVASAPTGIYCGVSCSSVFEAGAPLTLTAFPDAGATFVGWTGDCAATSGTTCTVDVSAARNVVATFTNPLSVVKSGTGTGTVTSNVGGINCGVTCGSTYTSGATVILTAAPTADSEFAGWTGACAGTALTCTLTMDAAKTVTAFFQKASYLMFMNREGNGTVTSTPAGISCGDTCAASFDAGATVALTAQPETGATFAGWRGACTGTGTCSILMNSVKFVSARFGYPLTVSTDAGGVVSSSPSGISCGTACTSVFLPGDTVVLTATPNAGRAFAGWSGACSGTSPSCTVPMNAAKSVTASFGYTLSLSFTGSGSIDSTPAGLNCGPSCVAGFASGSYVTLRAAGTTATDQVTSWTGCDAIAGNTCSVLVNANKSVSATFGATPWRESSTGMLAGSVSALALDPTNPNVLYASTGSGAVFKTVSLGASWSAATSGLPGAADNAQGAGVTATSTAGTLYAATRFGKAFKSTNGGATWTLSNTGLSAATLNGLHADPTNANVVYASTTSGVFKTSNGGGAWASSSTGLAASVAQVSVSPASASIVYAATNAGVFRSTDSGASWSALNAGLTSVDVRELAFAPGTPATMYAATAGGLFKTTDGGATWAASSTGLTSTNVTSAAVDPTNSAIVFAGTQGGVFRSGNAGATFSAVPGASNILASVAVSRLAVNAAGVTFAVTDTKGVYRSADSGQSWTFAGGNLAPISIASVAFAPSDPTRVYAASYASGGVFRSNDGGATWVAANAGLPAGGIQSLAVDPTNIAIVYAGTQNQGVYRSADAGLSWTAINAGLSGAGLLVDQVVVNPTTPATVYIGTDAGVLKSTNSGASWSAASTGLTNTSLRSLAIDPVTPQTLYAGTNGGGVFKTTDGGASWSAINAGSLSASSSIYALAIDPTNPQLVYAGAYGGQIYKTTNGGGTWTLARSGSGSILALAINPLSPSTVYAGTHPQGVFKSTDAGANWTATNTGLPTLSVQHIAVDPTSGAVLLGTTNVGLWKSNTGGQ